MRRRSAITEWIRDSLESIKRQMREITELIK